MIRSLGIIGCGAVTQNQYAKVLGMFHDISVDHVFDINPELSTAVAAQFNAKSATKEELIAKSDIIVIATPPSTHFSLVKEALIKGKKVICEKPFVGTVEECAELSETARQNGAELYVAHFRRTFPSVKLARSIVESGVLGAVTGIELYEGGKFSWQTQSGYVYKDIYGGVLFDTGSHTIDTALYMACLDTVAGLTAEPVSIERDKPEPAHEISAHLALKSNHSVVDLKVMLSRKLLLSNKIKIKCASGYIDVPVGMASYIRVGGANGSTVVYSNVAYGDLMDCFAVQFKDMFYDVKNSDFSAEKFINLTQVLETIAKS